MKEEIDEIILTLKNHKSPRLKKEKKLEWPSHFQLTYAIFNQINGSFQGIESANGILIYHNAWQGNI